jgi:hypothetical protein
MPARGAYDAPGQRNEYLVALAPRLTQDGLLAVFYTPVLELARLMQATAVPQDLDPLELARRTGEDRWYWSASLPMQVEKLWADLQAVRTRLQRDLARERDDDARKRRRAQPADADLVRGCMHLYNTLDSVVRHVTPQLAAWFVNRQVVFADRLPSKYRVLSGDPVVADNIRRAWEAGAFQRALALYFRAQITEALDARGVRRAEVGII